LRLRAARPDEHSLLSAIARQAKAHWGYAPADLAAWQLDLTVTRKSLLERTTVVAEVDGAVAGFFQQHLEGSLALLDHLWVLPALIRRGVGSALLARARHDACAGGASEIHIDADPHAEAFYVAQGAQRVGEVTAPVEGQPQRVRPQLRLPAS
jgi:N-acetylglutamate synthase-like GNAT family acetyltransferase